jgi:hypothetical protein
MILKGEKITLELNNENEFNEIGYFRIVLLIQYFLTDPLQLDDILESLNIFYKFRY